MTATKNCERCAVRCRVVAQRTLDAEVFVKGTIKPGRLCTNCLVVDFFKNFDCGPSAAMGAEFFENFDPEGLRLPHIQEIFGSIVKAAAEHYGAELTCEEIDWDEVIANWQLPFSSKRRKKN